MTANTRRGAQPDSTQPSKPPPITPLRINNPPIDTDPAATEYRTANLLPQPGIGNDKPRLIGIDVTRGLALLGMIAVHALIPFDEDFQPNWVSDIATGHASAVFAVLAGVGLSLTTGRSRVPWSKVLPTSAGVAGRAAAIAVIGLALGYTDAEIAGVILPYYALLFLFAIPLLFLRTRTLVVVALFAAVAVPVLSQLVRPALPIATLENPTFTYLMTDPLGLLSELAVTGAYPALPWMAYICTGLIVGRLTLSSVKVGWRLLIVGASLAIAAGVAAWLLLGPVGGRAALQLAGPGVLVSDGDSVEDLLTFGFDGTTPTTSWWWLASGAPHGGTPLDLLTTIGSAVALLGAMLLLGQVAQPKLRRVIGIVMAPLAAAGGMTLTLYTAHVVFMNSPLDIFEPMDGYIVQVITVLLFGLGWRFAVGRGPLETAVTAVATRARTTMENAVRNRGAIRPPAGDLQRGKHRPVTIEPSPVRVTRRGPKPTGQRDNTGSWPQHSVGIPLQLPLGESVPLPPASTSAKASDHAASSAGGPSYRATERAATTISRSRSVRLTGIDITRGLALLGMMAVHTLIPYNENLDPNWVSYIATGHSSATFAVLAGVGLSLTTGRSRVPWAKAGPTAAAIAGRAAAIGVVGLALGYTDASIAGIILPYYALLFVLAIPLVLMRTRTVVLTGIVAAIVVPVLSQFLRPALPVPTGENLTFGYFFSDPAGMLSELLFTGSYPVLPWTAYICAGIVVGRMSLSSFRVAWRLLICGAALGLAAFGTAWALLGPLGGTAALQSAGAGDMGYVDDLLAFGFDGTTPTTSWWWLATGAPHAGTPLDLLGTIGGAVALLGAMLLLGHIAQPTLRRVIAAITAPLAAAGAMTLTLYTAHVVFMNSQLEVFSPTTAYVIQVVSVLLFGVIWRQTVGRGPLEAAVSAVSMRTRALATGPASMVADENGPLNDDQHIEGSGQPNGSVPSPTSNSYPAVIDPPGIAKGPGSAPTYKPTHLHPRPLPTPESRRLPGPFVARPPQRTEGTRRRPAHTRPER